MPSLIAEYPKHTLILGNHHIYEAQQVHGLEDLPPGIDGTKVLSLELPSMPIKAAGLEVGAREFYLCYSLQHSFLFVVETEMGKRVETKYRAQYGANDNYDSHTDVRRIVWVYSVDSAKAKDPVIAAHLQPYLPLPK